MISKFKIIMSSDLDYEELCAEIYFEDQFVAMLTQENGIENMEIEIHPPQNKKFWSFKFSDFETIMESAKKSLYDMKKNIVF